MLEAYVLIAVFTAAAFAVVFRGVALIAAEVHLARLACDPMPPSSSSPKMTNRRRRSSRLCSACEVAGNDCGM